MKILLVDDEELTRTYLSKIMDWDAMGIQIAGTPENGERALELFRKTLPELVITDIRMPLMDGLTLIKEIRSISSKVKIIVLSAFGDFEYARKAFGFGITGYILKPIDEEKLETLLFRALGEIKAEHEELRRKRIKNNLVFEAYLKRNLFHPEKDEFFHMKLDELGLDNWFDRFQLFSLFFSDSSLDQAILSGLIGEAWKDEFSEPFYILSISANQWLLVSLPGDSVSVGHFLKRLEQVTGLAVFLCVSSICKRPSDLVSAYREIGILESYSFYGEPSPLFFSQEFEIREKIPRVEEEALFFIEHLKKGEETGIAYYLTGLEKRMKEGFGPDLEAYYSFCLTLLVLVRSRMKREILSSPVPDMLKKLTMEELKKFTASSELTEYFLDICRTIFSGIKGLPGDSDSRFISRTKEYILEHYGQNITLDRIAVHLAVSRNYLSRIFRKETGSKIWDYLADVRMEKARILLAETNLKTVEIAERVGYENSTYFSSVFKKKNGMTPKEYRNISG